MATIAPRTTPTTRPATLGDVEAGDIFRTPNGTWHTALGWDHGCLRHRTPAGVVFTTEYRAAQATVIKK